MNKTKLLMLISCRAGAALAAIYNLQGQRLDTLQRSVNIIGETKTIVK